MARNHGIPGGISLRDLIKENTVYLADKATAEKFLEELKKAQPFSLPERLSLESPYVRGERYTHWYIHVPNNRYDNRLKNHIFKKVWNEWQRQATLFLKIKGDVVPLAVLGPIPKKDLDKEVPCKYSLFNEENLREFPCLQKAVDVCNLRGEKV